jgi:hypothetical protein
MVGGKIAAASAWMAGSGGRIGRLPTRELAAAFIAGSLVYPGRVWNSALHGR